MKRVFALAAAVLATACAGGSGGEGAKSSSATAITAADSTAIVALNDRLKAAAVAANWDAWGAEYTADPVRLPPNAGALVGKAAADAFNRTSPKFGSFEIAVGFVTGRNDLAVTTGTFKAMVPAARDAAGKATPAISESGKFMQLLMKQPDGSWKIARDIWNSDEPLPGATGVTKK